MGRIQTDGHMERESSYHLCRGKELLETFGNVLPPEFPELRESTLCELSMPVMEINSSGRMWVSLLADLLRSGGDITTLAPLRDTVRLYQPGSSAVR